LDSASRDPLRVLFAAYPLHLVACARQIGGIALPVPTTPGVPIEDISRLVNHSSTTSTETIYCKQIRPVIVHGADVMDRILLPQADKERSQRAVPNSEEWAVGLAVLSLVG
jgi:hypothetical protein